MTSNELELTDQQILQRILEEGGGLEDFDPTEGGIPRIRIDHKQGMWVENLTGQAVKEFDGVICGMVKQRVMFPPKLTKDGGPPECKSVDFKIGVPNVSTFPKDEYLDPPAPLAPGIPFDLVEGATIQCSGCPFREFGSHPASDKDGPRCTEQMIFIVMADFSGTGDATPAFLTLQKTSLKPARNYLAPFARGNIPIFSVVTRFSLVGENFSGNDYSVARLTKGVATDQSLWAVYARNYTDLRAFLQTRRGEQTQASVAIEDELEEF